MKKQVNRAGTALAIAALLALAGCGTSTVSKNISDDGRAGEVVFPNIENDAWLKEGTYPNLDNLRRIAPGVSKDQLYDLVGRPHFRESLFGVREWDYIFNFRVPGGVKTCQYKVIYDTALRAQSFHWLPADCAELLNPSSPPVEAVVEKAAAPQRFELSVDALFAFSRSSAADLLPQGRRELDALAAKLREARQVDRLRIIGHTDRLGSPPFNERLSLARAMTVRDHLVHAGVAARDMQVQGRGEAEPKVQCEQKGREELIACLAPNRRVEIEVYGAQ